MNCFKSNIGITVGGIIGALLAFIVIECGEHLFSKSLYVIIIAFLPGIGAYLGNHICKKRKTGK